MQQILITGASTGIGLSTATRLARHGYAVFAGVRMPETADQLQAAIDSGLSIEMVRLDVNSDASVADAVATVLRKAGLIDVLINNAGIGGLGAIELTPLSTVKEVFETNYFGAIRMIQAVLPQMRERRSGTIVNVSSLAGRIAGGFQGPYAASKWALVAASEALAVEVTPFGIRVAIIEPGVVVTPILSKGSPPDLENMPYTQDALRLQKFFEAQLTLPTLPEAVAETIQTAMESDTPRLRYIVGRDAALVLKWRQTVSDEDWTASGLLSDEEFYTAAAKGLGVDLYHRSANATE